MIMESVMHIVHVHIRVNPEVVAAFRVATLENVRNSVREPGVARFELLQDYAEPTRFILVEWYRTAADQEQHRTTAHYFAWRDAVAPMMAEPRRAARYDVVEDAR
jgi:(4S)-4-hydroxy-5-phosphonooxypentane-2,3-dione isomerase